MISDFPLHIPEENPMKDCQWKRHFQHERRYIQTTLCLAFLLLYVPRRRPEQLSAVSADFYRLFIGSSAVTWHPALFSKIQTATHLSCRLRLFDGSAINSISHADQRDRKNARRNDRYTWRTLTQAGAINLVLEKKSETSYETIYSKSELFICRWKKIRGT